MAKALYAPVLRTDPRMMAELAVLRARVAELQQENDALRLEIAVFAAEAEEPVAPVVLA